MTAIGAVAIGRNEGERLRVCLASLVGRASPVVYVDSGSTDGSAEMAAAMGALVVALDMSLPFTAARARNEGFARLMAAAPETAYVQFVDGDCEVGEGWLAAAAAELDAHPQAAAVWGRLEERFPDATIYNRMAHLEWQWDLPFGEVETFGGIILARTAAVAQVQGYTETLIAGEERDFAVRLRKAGWTIRRIDALMVRHDIAMTRFGQWWKRSKRTGFAYAQGEWRRRGDGTGTWRKETASIWRWGVLLPWGAILLALPTLGLSLLLWAALYGLQTARLYRYMARRGFPHRDRLIYALFVTAGKFPNGLGLITFHANRLRGKREALIEYK